MNFHKKYLILFIFYFLIDFISPFNLSGQNKNEDLATVGNITISSEEFIRRYEFTPHPQNKLSGSIDPKKEFLFTIIAEKLLSQEAVKLGLNRDEDLTSLMMYLKGVYLRDALYQIEIKNKVNFSDSLVKIGKERIKNSLSLKFLFSQDKNEIDSLYTLLNNQVDFDSLLVWREEYAEQDSIRKVTYGEMHPLVENEVYNLLPGHYSKPIKMKEGWYIFKILSIETKSESGPDEDSKVKRIISNRLEDELYEKFYKDFFKGITINADKILFRQIADHLFSYIKSNEKLFLKSSRANFQLGESEIKEVIHLMKNELSKTFIKFPENPISVKLFLNQLLFSGINFNLVDSIHVQKVLSSTVFNFIQNELLIREALKRGYDRLPMVQNELKIWNDYYLSQRLMKKLYLSKSVSDEEALQFYNKENRVIHLPDSVKIAEINTTSLDAIGEILESINDKPDLAAVAKKFEHRIINPNRIVSNYFAVTERGEIGKIASQMDTNQVFGPLKTSEGYSLIQLLDKKNGLVKKYAEFEEVKDEIKNILRSRKMLMELDTLTTRIALESNLKINYDILNRLKLTDVNIIVLKRFGFGGQLLAVPYSQPFSSWYNLYLEEYKKNLP
jgi:hypothetical protein